KMAYELADGTVREYPFGLVRIEFMGETTAGRVIFGAPGAEPLLGVTALESVGIIVDPANKTLKRLPAIPLKYVGSTHGSRNGKMAGRHSKRSRGCLRLRRQVRSREQS